MHSAIISAVGVQAKLDEQGTYIFLKAHRGILVKVS